jgi:hypothetical protein
MKTSIKKCRSMLEEPENSSSTQLTTMMRIQKTVLLSVALVLAGLCLPAVVQAQTTPDTPARYAFTAGYFGEVVTHPGAVIGVERYLFTNQKFRFILAGNLGGYVHPRNHSAMFVNVQSGQRITFRSGLFLDQFLGLGYLHTFLHDGDLYQADVFGNIQKTPNTGRPHVMPSVSVGTGWDLSKGHTGQLLVYVRPQVFWQFPFNNYALVHFALQTGITFQLN